MTPSVCPGCGEAYEYRVPRRYDSLLQMRDEYRCGPHGGHLYIHKIPPEQGIRVPYNENRPIADGGTVHADDCPDCGLEVEPYRTYSREGQFGVARRIRVYLCPRCGARWESQAPFAADGGLDPVEQLIEQSDAFDELEAALGGREDHVGRVIADWCDQMSGVCLDMARQLERADLGTDRFRLDDDQVLTDGGLPDGTAPKAEVDVVAWASHLDVGDVVSFETPAGVLEAEVRGFSTWNSYEGQPVVDWPDGVEAALRGRARLLVLREEDLVEDQEYRPELVTDGGDEREALLRDLRGEYVRLDKYREIAHDQALDDVDEELGLAMDRVEQARQKLEWRLEDEALLEEGDD